jgi:hypothetical protein
MTPFRVIDVIFMSVLLQLSLIRPFSRRRVVRLTFLIGNVTSATYSLSRKCARMFAANMCHRDSKKFTTELDAVVISTCGGYGNNFIQLMSVLAFCLVMKIKLVYVARCFLWLWTVNFTTPQGIRVIPVDHPTQVPFPRERWVYGGWWTPDHWCGDWTYRYLAAQVREPLLSVIPTVTVDPDMLFLYLRGGHDIWNATAGVHRNYAQPPCSFYLDPMRNFTTVRALGGTLHPCLEVVMKAGAQWEPFNDTLDMARMIYAHHIALARSSRSHAVLALSPFPKQFWVYDQPAEWVIGQPWWFGYSPLQFGHGIHCMPSKRYREVTWLWRASDVQVEFVLNSSCEWGQVPCKPGLVCPLNNVTFGDEPV